MARVSIDSFYRPTLCMDAEVFKGLQKVFKLSNMRLSDILDMPLSLVSAYRTGNGTIPKTVTTITMLILIINVRPPYNSSNRLT